MKDGGREPRRTTRTLTLCDTGFNSSWNLRTRRCEVIQIGDRGYVTQIASSKLMRNPVLGDRAFGHTDNVFKPDGKHVRLHFGDDSLLL